MSFDFTRVLYASGNFGKNILWGTADITLLFVLTDMLGITPAVSGLILLCSLIADAVIDPLVGMIADHTRTALGRYGPLILIGAPLSALTFSGIYYLPLAGVDNIWIIAALIISFRASYSFIDLPHNALMVHVTGDSRERGRLSGYRFFFSSLASLTLALSLTPLVKNSGDELSASALAQFAVIISCVSLCVMVASWFVVRKKDRQSTQASVTARSNFRKPGVFLSSPAYLIALGAGCIATLTLPLFGKSLLYIAVHMLNAPQAASQLMTAMVFGQFLGIPLWITLSGRQEKSRALQYAHLISVAGFLSLAASLAFAQSLLPVASLVIGTGMSGVYAIIWSMTADCVDDVEAISGQRPEGVLFAFAVFGQKAAIGVGVGIYGIALQWAGYDADAHASVPVAMVISLMGLGLPVLGSILCIFLLNSYPLSHSRHSQLVQRKAVQMKNIAKF